MFVYKHTYIFQKLKIIDFKRGKNRHFKDAASIKDSLRAEHGSALSLDDELLWVHGDNHKQC